jgi:hypothetical protein
MKHLKADPKLRVILSSRVPEKDLKKIAVTLEEADLGRGLLVSRIHT